MILKFVYIIFIGILLSTFIGVGIAAFYPEPKYPETPAVLRYPLPVSTQPDSSASAAQIKEQIEYDEKNQEFQKTLQDYNKNVSIIVLVFAILIMVVSLTLFKKLLIIADGLLLGGVLTLIYSIIRGFSAGDNIFRFIVVSVGLAVALILGYLKFVKTQKS